MAFGKKTERISKVSESRGEVLLDLYYEKSCFWAKALVAFGPFGWLLAFTKAKAGSKANQRDPKSISYLLVIFFSDNKLVNMIFLDKRIAPKSRVHVGLIKRG